MGVCHTPNSEFNQAQFMHEIKHPLTIQGASAHDSYQFYMLNQQYSDQRPLIAYNGLGSTPNTLAGILHLKAYARTIPRPIIAPMNSRSPSTADRQKFANNHAQALRRVVDEPVDIVGVSWGGTLGYLVAESIGDQANHLVTASSVGTINNLGRYALASSRFLSTESRQLKGTITATMHSIDTHDVLETPPSLHNIDKLRLVKLIIRQSFSHIPFRLHPQTSWHDIVGQNDIFTSVDEHLATVARRNQLYPASSRISIVDNHGHLWSHMRQSLADIVLQSLCAADNTSEATATAVEHLRSRDDFLGIDSLST